MKRTPLQETRRKLGQYEYFRAKNVKKFLDKDEHFRGNIAKLQTELAALEAEETE